METLERPGPEHVAAPPTAVELERLMAAHLKAAADFRLTRAALREGLARHEVAASLPRRARADR